MRSVRTPNRPATIPEAVDRQAGAGERGDRQCELDDYECLAQPSAAAARRRAAALLQRLVQIHLTGLPRGRRFEQQPAHRRGEQREQEDRHAELRVGFGRQHAPRDHREQGLKEPGGRDDAQHPARCGEHETFGEHLADQANAASAQRCADCHLALAHRAAREQQVGYVHTRNRHDESHRGQQQPERRPRIGTQEIVLQRFDRNVPTVVRLRSVLLELGGDAGHLVLGLFDADARLEASHDQQPSSCVVIDLGGLERERHPQVRRQAIGWPRRQHADDRVGPSVHSDVASDDAGIGSVAEAPEAVAEQHDLVLRRLIVPWLEIPAERDGLAKHPMPVGCDAPRPYAERLFGGRQVESTGRERLQILDDVADSFHAR